MKVELSNEELEYISFAIGVADLEFGADAFGKALLTRIDELIEE